MVKTTSYWIHGDAHFHQLFKLFLRKIEQLWTQLTGTEEHWVIVASVDYMWDSTLMRGQRELNRLKHRAELAEKLGNWLTGRNSKDWGK